MTIDRDIATRSLARAAVYNLPAGTVADAVEPLCTGSTLSRAATLAALLRIDQEQRRLAPLAENDDREALRLVHLFGAAESALVIATLCVTPTEIEARYEDAVERLRLVGVEVVR